MVVGDTGSTGLIVKSGNTNFGGVYFADGTTGAEQYKGFVQYNHDHAGSVDELLFGTDGTAQMRIDSAGNVGIGIAVPTTMLHLDQASNDRAGGLYIERNGSNYGLSMFVNAGGYGIIGSNGDYTTDILTLDLNGGKVGIGDSAPNTKLEVNGDTTIRREGSETSGELLLGGTTDGGFVDFDSTNLQLNTQRDPNTGTFINAAKSHATIQLLGPTGGSSIKFGTAAADNTVSTTRMTINKDGYFGINCAPVNQRVLAIQNSAGDNEIEFIGTAYTNIYSNTTDEMSVEVIGAGGDLKLGTTGGNITINSDGNVTQTGAYTDNNGVRTYNEGGTMVNSASYTIDITVKDDTGYGTVHHITAMMTHFSTTYGCVLDCYAYTRGTGVDVQTDLLNQSNAAAGGWTVSKPDTTTLRLTKSAGTYSGSGNYQVVVVTKTP